MDATDHPVTGRWNRRSASHSSYHFRVAARFTGQNALFLHQAIADAVSNSNIKVMPAKHTSFSKRAARLWHNIRSPHSSGS
jgi:hypothetical protein